MKEKSEVYQLFLSFEQFVKRQFECKIKEVQSDWGGEYRCLSTHFKQTSTHHCVSCPHTYEQNGTSKRKIRHVVDKALLCLLTVRNKPLKFCDYSFETAIYLINRLPTPILSQSSLYHSYMIRKPIMIFSRPLVFVPL